MFALAACNQGLPCTSAHFQTLAALQYCLDVRTNPRLGCGQPSSSPADILEIVAEPLGGEEFVLVRCVFFGSLVA